MFCTKCGKKLSDDAKFCQFCGASISGGNAKQSKTESDVKSEEDNFFWAYRFTESEVNNLSVARHYIEQKRDYFPVKTELNSKNIFIYQKGKGKKTATVILYKQKDQVLIFGNDNGYIMVRSRYLNKNFKEVKKEKIYHNEIANKDVLNLLNEFNIKKGNQHNGLVGVGGWLTYFIIGIIISIISILVYAFIPPLTWWSLLDIGLAIYASYAVYLLIKIKPHAVRHTTIMLGIFLVENLILLVMIGSSESWSSVSGTEDSPYSFAFRGIVYCIIWLLYFRQSKRVKNTYTN